MPRRYISDRLGRIEVAAFLTTANGVIIFAFWVPATSYGLLIFFSLISELWFVYWVCNFRDRLLSFRTNSLADDLR